ncbi:SDR family NAD(P)-dependent oxidoreductase [Williamsia sterculiae]|uniref:3-oxoacyl-[acyl-carrier protein] reductase/tetrahydroxynaphthalene reductase n=1 Tax=Williamsia sterculiae TaxID=1344003 RepID=A0A1N7FWN6_9NOCA|nr:SDR family oxidoreductase [Williamsia sterculiae]SIS04645.1 3-oxoacyl-[acyl-carrier protein] reductase/tetrahydroxynaphthalene reductase [Williamsia sterculiae]
MPALTGKRALVTGGGRGIGAAIVRRLAADGAHVAINYRAGKEAATALEQEISSCGGTSVALQADLSQDGAAADLVGRTVDVLGGLDILVSNAGIEHFGALETITRADVDRVFGINVAAQLFVTQAAAAVMGQGGRIVLTSSVSARIAVHHHTLYAASKAAVSAIALNLAPELAGRAITINAIAPGGTNTDMAADNAVRYTRPQLRHLPQQTRASLLGAIGRLAEPSEIAAAVAFLISPDASYITGSTLAIDGGWM